MNSEELLKRYKEDCHIRNIGAIKVYESGCKIFAEFMKSKDKDLLEVGKEDLKEYLVYLRDDRKVKFSTIDRVFTILSSFYIFLVEEEYISSNPIIPFRKRYLRRYKGDNDSETRQIISIEDAAKLVNSILETRDRAMALLLLKTGMRLGELLRLDVEDVDLVNGMIKLKATPKRSNRVLFFDEEVRETLAKWLTVRDARNRKKIPALFISREGNRICSHQVKKIISNHAARIGLHDPSSKRLEERFTPHCCRHWFTTHLIRAGMPRDFVKELRGDVRHEAIDIYNHIDKKELRESYLAHIPQLGI